MNYIFNQKLLKRKYDAEIDLSLDSYKQRRALLEKWKNIIVDGAINTLNETQLREVFVIDIFSNILRYSTIVNSPGEYNIITEEKTKVDGTKADVVLGYFTNKTKDYRVAIELKGPESNLDSKQLRKNDNRTPVEQGFSYLPKYGKKCTWLIVTNYKEIRLYNSSDATEYESFLLKDICDDDDLFKKFLYLLSAKSLINKDSKSRVERLWEENIKEQDRIEKSFYELYKKTRLNLFKDICDNNQDIDIRICLKKTQKILDRFIFVCFAEDKDLLPSNIFERCIEVGKNLSMSRFGVWEQVKGLFESIDLGNETQDINQFNGGLFAKDDILDNLKIPNNCFEYMNELSHYDFSSDLNENILGHIFEKSISDLEEIRLELDGTVIKKKEGKRNKDGIFYTPKYVTKYIVENSIGKYLEQKRIELGEQRLPTLTEEDYKTELKTKIINRKKVTETEYKTNNLQKHIDFWKRYREVVKNIKVLDPACGSGAFLNEAFNYLHKVGTYINDKIIDLTGEYSFFDLDKEILKNNLYGVDLNEESIEITKLSLWLKTANKYSLLTTLDNNIKCGNSLINDNEIEPDKSFDWNTEFKEVMNNGGFDVIIGNPPYVSTKSIPENHRQYYWNQYEELLISEIDLYELFLYEFCKNKLKRDGILGFITPNTYFTNKSFANLRKYLLNDVTITEIIDFPYRFFPFEDVNKETAIIVIKNNKSYGLKDEINLISINKENMKSLKIFNDQTYDTENQVQIKDIVETLDSKIVIKTNPVILKMIKCEDKLGNYLDTHKGWMSVPNETICNGITYKKKILDSKDIEENAAVAQITSKCLEGKDIQRYGIKNVDKFVNIECMDAKTWEWHKQPKIITQRIVGQNKNKIIATVDEEGYVIFPSANVINLVDKKTNIIFYLGILNSKAISYFYNIFYGESNTNITKEALDNIPIGDIKIIDKDSFISNTKVLIDGYKSLSDYVNKFINNIFKRFNISGTVPKKFESFYLMELDEFIKELEKKKKSKVTLKELDEIEEYFVDYKNKMKNIIDDINKSEVYINGEIYKSYGLDEDEIKLIEMSF